MNMITDEMLNTLLRQKGMKTVVQLSNETGVNRITLSGILKGKRKLVQSSTFERLNNWLYQHI